MSEHAELIAKLQEITKNEWNGNCIVNSCNEAIAALQGIQSKTDEPKIEADITLRNHFAGLVLAALIGNNDLNVWDSDELTGLAYEYADKMLAKSKK